MFDFVPGFFLYLIVMAVVTYLVRMIPLALVTRKITNRFVRSFLYYIPYTVLSAMVFPSIFFSTGNIISATAGAVVAIALSYFKKSLLTVSTAATLSALAAELICALI